MPAQPHATVKAGRIQTQPTRQAAPAKPEPTLVKPNSTPANLAAPTQSAATAETAAANSPPPLSGNPERNTDAQRPSTPTSGYSTARAIAQPLPTVPDDLREQAYQTVATARFVIHTDGSAAVELIRPTQYPRLNQILIETLRGWRFVPAMQDGHPVESSLEIRVHFNVS
ncbi:energy transducer TonB [Paraburkholderia sp. IMGN_8]|uniref:energy transducer TonB n=1 Tax=Paraburkholderia sp. IMGN_8 TaxID=3136564 RepID=UPI0031017E7A